MFTAQASPPPESLPPGTGLRSSRSPRRTVPPGGLDIALLRQLDPDSLLVQGRPCIDRATWMRHVGQRRDLVLVASRPRGTAREVVGTLELHEERTGGHGPRRGMIDRLFVLDGQRRRGVGTRLMRAAIAFARASGFAVLRESIPNLLAYDAAVAGWRAYIPTGEEFGGLRSLGATLNACAAEGQPCRVVSATHRRAPRGQREPGRGGHIGAVLDLPLASPGSRAWIPGGGTPIDVGGIVADLARLAGVTLADGEADPTPSPRAPGRDQTRPRLY